MRGLSPGFRASRRALLLGAAALSATRTAAARLAPRVVSIGGGITEIVYAIGAQKLLVGVDTTSNFPDAASALPNVGYARALSAEGVLALAPTLVLAAGDAGPPAVLRQIRQAGIAVELLEADHSFEGLIGRIQRIGGLTGRAEAARAVADKITRDWAGVRRRVTAAEQSPRVLFLMGFDTARLMVAGRRTAAQAMLDYVGARNAAEGFTGYKPLTPEALISARPDVLLTTRQALDAGGGVSGLLHLPGMAQTPAGRAQRVVASETMFLLGFGPRLPAAVDALHGELAAAMRS